MNNLLEAREISKVFEEGNKSVELFSSSSNCKEDITFSLSKI